MRALIVPIVAIVLTACTSERIAAPVAPAPIPEGRRLASGQPMILLDGKEISSRELDTIDPESIETVEVIKGAAAARLYGTSSGHGVILIRTRNSRR